jgi:spermidine/putrescine transport system substrate-binding protein
MRNESREALGVSLKALGYSINSENPVELEAALAHLLEAEPLFTLVDETAEEAAPLLVNGDFAILVGWAEDVLLAREENEHITYILPEDGPMLWGDNFVIPTHSPHQYTAELFLNFLLQDNINAMLVNENYYATPNQAAAPFITPEIRTDPLIFPPNEKLIKAEVFLPLSPAGEKLYQEIWERFLAATQTE